MKVCPKCGKELNDTAKFCGGCGTKLEVAQTDSANICHQCGNPLRENAKFCGVCGTKIENKPVEKSNNSERVGNSGFIRWTILPGQLAVKIDESEILAYDKVKGIAIQEGVKALLFVNGKLVSELSAGNYKFAQAKNEKSEAPKDRNSGFWGLLKRSCETMGRMFSRTSQALTEGAMGDRTAISAVLVRATDFPLIFNVANATTANIRSDVGLHAMFKITNVNEFYKAMLLDSKFISFEAVGKKLKSVVETQVNLAVSAYSPETVANNLALQQGLLEKLQSATVAIYPFIEVSKIIQLSANNEAIENLRRLAEELYVSEAELVQLQKRNDFLNRLQSVKNEQELVEIGADNNQELGKDSLEADFQKKKLDIYKQMELTDDDCAKFDLMLGAERLLREAKSDEDIAVALHEYKKSGLLRDVELENLSRKTAHDAQMQDLRNTQEYDMTELRGDLEKSRLQDEYIDERRAKDAQFQDERRRAEMDLDNQEMRQQMDLLKQAQALRMERENSEHQRELEKENAARLHEETMQKQKLEATLENQRIYAGMTFEQIMAANPDISAEAAKALAQKFASDSKEELLKAREADMAKMNSQQMEIMRMMQQMAMAGMGAKQEYQDELLKAKQDELERNRDDSNKNQDRFLSGMQTTISAVASASSRARIPQSQPQIIKCPKCGTCLESGASFCGECGASIK